LLLQSLGEYTYLDYSGYINLHLTKRNIKINQCLVLEGFDQHRPYIDTIFKMISMALKGRLEYIKLALPQHFSLKYL
jgi:hypothetical protein